jgi:hypothetical protein
MRIPPYMFVFGLRSLVVGIVLHDATRYGSVDELIPLFVVTAECLF